ncbi:uncharacterized protein [Rutidosis leptorrhynchoides]|uniref:uncharacterized protein n=1 Tax=Rutidosis leptorrhynchoides TaxID=125765 RepID=UPI003A995300
MHTSRKRERDVEVIATSATEKQPNESNEVVINHLYPDQVISIGINISSRLMARLQKLLYENQDIFAWTPCDMIGIPRELAEQRLNIHPRTFTVRQKKSVLAKECYEEVNQEECFTQRGRNVEIYIDDMVIKSRDEGNAISEIEETFNTLRRLNMKLNPKKCIFEVQTGQFLGHMITKEWIEANPEKIKAIVNMTLPKTELTVPIPGESLTLYIGASHEAISSVLMAEREHAQKPIYFVSKTLQGPEVNYPTLEKLALALPNPQKTSLQKKPHKKTSPVKNGTLSWTLYTDGASSTNGSGAGLILTDPHGKEITYALQFEYHTSNNEAEYEAFIAGLEHVTREAHVRICGAHEGARTIAQKVARLGYFWPKMYKDPTKITEACRRFQERTPITRKSQCDMISKSIPWPFQQWGIDLVGLFPEASRRVKFLVVAIDYFSKWVEAEPLAIITERNIVKFVWQNIICRFGILGIIISDNGKQFSENPFHDWCNELNIKQKFTFVAHPQANGKIEVTNRTLI